MIKAEVVFDGSCIYLPNGFVLETFVQGDCTIDYDVLKNGGLIYTASNLEQAIKYLLEKEDE